MGLLSCFGKAFFLQLVGHPGGTVDTPRGLHHLPPQITLHPIFQMHRWELARLSWAGGRQAAPPWEQGWESLMVAVVGESRDVPDCGWHSGMLRRKFKPQVLRVTQASVSSTVKLAL